MNSLETIFQLIAVALIAVAAYSYYSDWQDVLFASAVLAVCSMFLAYRFRLKKRVAVRDTLAADDAGGDE